ncbi:hypothetical protein [Roseibium sp.]|uniref:hypothetical protein n=1 Tax=Roseibium sp. TaxID=1936156 RepID=UPI003D14761F
MTVKISKAHSGASDELENTLDRIKEIDRYKNLHDAVPILLFLTTGALAARSFFWLIDLMTWLGIGKLDALLPTSLSFVLLFVVWVLAFLGFMSLLDWMKFGNIRTLANNRLSNLALTTEEIHALKNVLKSKTWKHDHILKDVAAHLEGSRR